jgi:hypothetical protein
MSKMSPEEKRLKATGSFKCRGCGQIKALNERHSTYVRCRRCALERIRERWNSGLVRHKKTTVICVYCKKSIKASTVSVDARVQGKYHPGCLFKTLKTLNPNYQRFVMRAQRKETA